MSGVCNVSQGFNLIKESPKWHPDIESYSHVYAAANLLQPKTILAHGIYLTDDEMALIAQCGSSISHCPSSNINISSGLCDVRRLLKVPGLVIVWRKGVVYVRGALLLSSLKKKNFLFVLGRSGCLDFS